MNNIVIIGEDSSLTYFSSAPLLQLSKSRLVALLKPLQSEPGWLVRFCSLVSGGQGCVSQHPASLVLKHSEIQGCSHFGPHSSFKGISRISISVVEAKAKKQRGRGSHRRPHSKLRTEPVRACHPLSSPPDSTALISSEASLEASLQSFSGRKEQQTNCRASSLGLEP